MPVFFKMKKSPLLLVLLYCLQSAGVKIVDNYLLNVTTSGPAVYGSNVTFQAVLYLGTSSTPEDPSKFRYEWKSNADELKDTQHAHFNTSLHRCYDSYIKPKKYIMEVTVYSEDQQTVFSPVASKNINFSITQNLNGNLTFNQTVYRSKLAENNVFSTKLPVNITANLTDIFQYAPGFTYKWYMNGKIFGGGNSPNSTYKSSDKGKYSVKVEVVSDGVLSDCKNYSYSKKLSGSFEADFVLKDPVTNLTLFGKKSVKQGQNLSLTAVFQGSPPYTFCWNLTYVEMPDLVLNKSCTPVKDAPISFISIPSSSLPQPGKYYLNMLIENDISMWKGHHAINVTAVPTPQPSSHSAGYVLGGVLGALGAVTLLLFLTQLYLNYRRNRFHHIESADFTFHTSIQTSPKGTRLWSTLKDMFQGLFTTPSSGRWQRISDSSVDRRGSRQYGSMVNLVE